MNLAKKPTIVVAGNVVRRREWTDCGVAVLDVGQNSFWGKVIDFTKRMVLLEQQFPLDADWHRMVILSPEIKN